MSISRSSQQWIVKDSEGRIYGPFSTDQVLAQIDKAYFVGDEQIAPYPGGQWIPISRSPEFYDRLLDVLADEVKGAAAVIPPPPTQAVSSSKSSTDDDEDEKDSMQFGSLSATRPIPIDGSHQPVPQNSVTQPIARQGSVAVGTQGSQIIRPPVSDVGVIELTDLKKLERKENLQSSRLPLFIIMAALILAGVALLLPDEKKVDESNRIRLLAPRKGQPELGDAKLKEKFKRALVAFQSDTFSGYQKAQNELVEMVEGAPEKPEMALQKAEWLSTLCITYRELWPFSYQDSRDTKTLSLVMQDAKRLDAGGKNGATCEIVQLMLSGRYRDAQGLTDSMLSEESQTPVLFEIRGDIYRYVRDSSNANNYFEQAKMLWPGWKKTSIQLARAKNELKQFPQAIQLYRDVLQAVPRHAVAKIELGLIEGVQFAHFDIGMELLRSGLDSTERVPSELEGAGLFGIAQIYERQNQSAKALEYARRAYKLNSANLAAKNMIVRLGGSTQEIPKADPRGLMFLGDQYVRTGDCFAAQAEFKAAFEAEPKNGVAAMKAGKCLWDLNQSLEAIEWMKKAIIADPALTAAHVELADYYARRFDYMAATQTLKRIQQKQPNNYEVYRGFATVELRRNNFKGAVTYGQRALKLYETDLDTFLIMTKAHIGLQEFQEAQKYAGRAIELDFNSTEAHSLYAKVEAGLHGVDQGANYMQQMINRYVITKGQQVPQAAVDFRNTLGEIYMQDERFKQAEEVFRQAVSLDRNSKKSLINLGKALQAQNQPSEALETFLRAAVLDPSDADPIFFSGQLYAETGKLPEAFRQFDRVMKINARYPRAHVQIGRVLLRQGDAKKALDEALAERVNNPDLEDSFLLAGESYFILKQYSNCAAEYQQASRRDRTSLILVRMARCYRLSGALDSAQSLLRQAQSLESGNPDLYKEQAAIFHMKGMADEAIAAYDTYLKLVPNAADKAEIESRIRRVQSGDLNVGE